MFFQWLLHRFSCSHSPHCVRSALLCLLSNTGVGLGRMGPFPIRNNVNKSSKVASCTYLRCRTATLSAFSFRLTKESTSNLNKRILKRNSNKWNEIVHFLICTWIDIPRTCSSMEGQTRDYCALKDTILDFPNWRLYTNKSFDNSDSNLNDCYEDFLVRF